MLDADKSARQSGNIQLPGGSIFYKRNTISGCYGNELRARYRLGIISIMPHAIRINYIMIEEAIVASILTNNSQAVVALGARRLALGIYL